ncbi:MAG: fibro-slime domain-containing protein [Fibrobacterales bacterium]
MHTLLRLTCTLILFLCIGCLDLRLEDKPSIARPISSDSNVSDDVQSNNSSVESSNIETSSDDESSNSVNDPEPSSSDNETALPTSPEKSEAECSDGIDNDQDALVDCFDPHCQGLFLCFERGAALCGNGSDDDSDGLVDCDEPACMEQPECEAEMNLEISSNEPNSNSDNISSDETRNLIGENKMSFCHDGIDNDRDGYFDCEDPECKVFDFCSESTLATCTDGRDNDLDGASDCEDPECQIFELCGVFSPGNRIGENKMSFCQDGVDNDRDGSFDCEDSECQVFELCGENSLYTCTDGIDNDLDGASDCEDPECWVVPGANCGELSQAMCDDDIDNDDDGLIDCDDNDCQIFDDICPFKGPNSGGDGTGGGDGNSGGAGAGVHAMCDGETLVLNRFEKFTMTIYDHDQNSDFGAAMGADMLRQGMVTNKLSSEKRPVFKENLHTNKNIGQWWSEEMAVSVTEVELPFAKVGEATYTFRDLDFFPLDDMSAKEGDSGLNYYFAGHLQWRFDYDGQRGQFFSISTSDDGFVYINGNLILDIGGVHTPIEDNFTLDTELDKLGIHEGETITIDFFIAERQKSGSQAIIEITMPCIVKN